METRLTILIDNLERVVTEANQMCQLTTTSLQDLLKTKYLLRQSLNQVDTEIHKYINQCSQDLITKGTKTQLSAEEILAVIEAILTSQLPSTSSDSGSSHCKLPKVELPKFSGDLLKWNEFWDRFESTVHKKSIGDADKLAYLIGCLDGKALEAVEGLATTNSNYKIALDTLQQRYGNSDMLVDAHYEALHSLPKALDTPTDCRNTLNIIERHLRVLHSLGECTESNHLRVTLLNKFPERVVYEVNVTNKDSFNSISSLRTNLEHIISATERAYKTQSESSHITAPSTTTESLLTISKNHTRKFKFNKNFNRRQADKNNINRKRKMNPILINSNSKQPKLECVFCKGGHYNSDCTEVKSIAERKEILGKRCYRCFKEGHNASRCKSLKKCFFCNSDHNQALCPRKIGTCLTNIFNIPNMTDIQNNFSFLQTAIVKLVNENKKETLCRVLLDSGSQRSYITKQAAKKLNLIPDCDNILIIYTFGSNKPKETLSPSAEIMINTKRGIKSRIRVNIVPHIIEKISVPTIQINNLVDIVADDDRVGERIDLLIGNDYYFSFMRNGKIKIQDNLFIVDSDFGWLITGALKNKENKKNTILSVVTYCKCDESHFPYYTEPDLPLQDMDLKFLWALESIGINDSAKATRGEEAIQHFNRTVKYENERYLVKWPWIQYPPELASNFKMALGRLTNLIRRLDLPTITEYDSIIQDQLKSGVIEIIPLEEINQVSSPLHYLPHHIIKQEGKQGRIVYDASAKTKMQKSLNECLYSGPCMIKDLNALLLYFRTNRVAISADVEKAFLQVGLQTEDRNVTRFLWLKDIEQGITNENLLYLRFCRIPFGIISSPFLLSATIKYHLSKKNDIHLKELAEKFYVDNLVTGTESTDEAKKLYCKTRKVFQELSMNVREWVSNDKEFLQWIPMQYRAKSIKEVKVLGLIWNIEQDTIQIKLKENIKSYNGNRNKREVLRIIASVFDPCGFVSPVILPAKLLLQDLWLKKLKWNDVLSKELEEKWLHILETLQTIDNIKIPRYIGFNIEISKNTKYELHCFTDASEKAYAAVVYLRIVSSKETKIVFIMSKSRVTPLKQKENLKIPRLELLGFTIGNRLITYVENSLRLPISKQYLWTDSTIVLCWMKSNKLLHPFVARRINEIKQNKNTEWRFVSTNDNPADIATRPERWISDKELWFNGPRFLLKNKDAWPEVYNDNTFCVAGESLVNTVLEEDIVQELGEYEEVCANIPNDHGENLISNVSTVKKLQAQYFPEEIIGKQTNLSRNLGLFMDVDGILRCQGRMAHTSWGYDMKHPMLLPADCNFTMQLIKNLHEQNYHVGVSHTLAILRKHYWVPKGRSQVQKVIRKCERCIRIGGGPYKLPPTPDLPPERANYSAPFTYTGIDYFGPLYVTTKHGKEKRWICLMTCLAVRAVHMEVVIDLSTQECLHALRRFIATRGVPAMIVSDNALQFKLSAEMLENSFCIQNQIKWNFIPQLAPWHGGFYERLIGIVKHCLRRTLDKHLLTDSQLLTVIKEVEAVLNTRPLTYVGSDIDYILKPADFLTLGKCIVTTPIESNCNEISVTKRDVIEGWKRGKMIIEEYKKMFVNQYLLSLRERYNHSVKQPRVRSNLHPKVGDIVQIKGESKNRDTWKVGKIVSLNKGLDGERRVAKVKVGESELVRSIGHLYPLEAAEKIDDEEIRTEDISEKEISLENNDNCFGQEFNIIQLRSPNSNKLGAEYSEVKEQGEIEINTIPEINTSREDIILEPTYSETIDSTDVKVQNNAIRPKRDAALKAREKIAEWTRQLIAVLFAVGSVAKERDFQL